MGFLKVVIVDGEGNGEFVGLVILGIVGRSFLGEGNKWGEEIIMVLGLCVNFLGVLWMCILYLVGRKVFLFFVVDLVFFKSFIFWIRGEKIMFSLIW